MFRGRGLDSWLPTYLKEISLRRGLRARREKGTGTTHILFSVCDHFEPRHAAKTPEHPFARMRTWHEGYRQMQDEMHRRYGLRPLHSWFYPPHHGDEHLAALAHMAFDGLGEVELHYHHHNDTEETLRRDLKATLARFRRAGLLLQQGEPPVESFGFIHGDWALDNSDPSGDNCGVNSELSLLQELGCWADLTMPSSNNCQTRKINSIYYAVDDPAKPKSHDWGHNARAGLEKQDGLLMIQGPLSLNWGSPKYPRIENSTLTTENWGRPDRIRAWLDCHVHVQGRPEWLFVKLHCHGAVDKDFSAMFGERAMDMHRILAEQYNDGRRYKLHYATARQAYNVVRAAEAGCDGDPSQYFDFALPPQATQRYCLDAPHDLKACTAELLSLENVDSKPETRLRVRLPGIEEISGQFSAVKIDARDGRVRLEAAHGPQRVTVRWSGADSAQTLLVSSATELRFETGHAGARKVVA